MPSRPITDYKVDLTQSVQHWDRATKLKRGIWEYFLRPVYQLLPGKSNRLRVPILRLMGARIGRAVHLQQRIRILMPWELEIDDYVAIAHDVKILNFTKVHIASMTVISQYAYLCTGTHDYAHPHFPLRFKPIRIESEVWVASGAFVAPGVHLRRGCVIGANSVVSKDMPEWHICAGNPCKPLKERVIKQTV